MLNMFYSVLDEKKFLFFYFRQNKMIKPTIGNNHLMNMDI